MNDDELLGRFFFAGFVEDARRCMAAVEGSGGVREAAREVIANASGPEDSCKPWST